jgi:hypothetical protein
MKYAGYKDVYRAIYLYMQTMAFNPRVQLTPLTGIRCLSNDLAHYQTNNSDLQIILLKQ